MAARLFNLSCILRVCIFCHWPVALAEERACREVTGALQDILCPLREHQAFKQQPYNALISHAVDSPFDSVGHD